MEAKRRQLVQRHRAARRELRAIQATRWALEGRGRTKRLRKGLPALWDWLTGRNARVHAENEEEVALGRLRDRAEKQALIEHQLAERRRLQHEVRQVRRIHIVETGRLNREIGTYLALRATEPTAPSQPEQVRIRRRRGPFFPEP